MTTPIVLIAPAMAVPSTFYRPLVAAFEARGWTATTLSRRGFGPDGPPASRRRDWSYGDEIDDVQRAVDAARAEAGDRPVLLFGHSLGGQLSAAVQLGDRSADGLVLVGVSVPHFRHYGLMGLGLGTMALTIPFVSRLVGHVPAPWFGAPGARTLMTEWAQMVWRDRLPYPVDAPFSTPTFAVHLEGDTYSVAAAAREFEQRLVAPAALTRWEYAAAASPAGGSTHHVFWVRTPDPVVDRVVAWWDQANASTGGQEQTRFRSP